MRPYTFDLDSLFPGSSLRRLQGSGNQDPSVNNGEPLGSTFTLDSKDGLFAIRIPSAAASVTVQYLDQKGSAVAPPATLTGTVGAAYEAVAATPNGYRLVTTPSNATGTFTDQPITVTFVYERVSSTSPGGGQLANTGSDTAGIGAAAVGAAGIGTAALIAKRLLSRGSAVADADAAE
jgi:hypothetical protein